MAKMALQVLDSLNYFKKTFKTCRSYLEYVPLKKSLYKRFI